jgi:hypothetical protein
MNVVASRTRTEGWLETGYHVESAMLSARNRYQLITEALGRVRRPDLISPRATCVNSFGRNFNDADLDGRKISGNILDFLVGQRGSDQRHGVVLPRTRFEGL